MLAERDLCQHGLYERCREVGGPVRERISCKPGSQSEASEPVFSRDGEPAGDDEDICAVLCFDRRAGVGGEAHQVADVYGVLLCERMRVLHRGEYRGREESRRDG